MRAYAFAKSQREPSIARSTKGFQRAKKWSVALAGLRSRWATGCGFSVCIFTSALASWYAILCGISVAGAEKQRNAEANASMRERQHENPDRRCSLRTGLQHYSINVYWTLQLGATRIT